MRRRVAFVCIVLSPVHSAGAGGVSVTGGVWEREGRRGYCGASWADGGNALPQKYYARHMLRLLPLRRPLPLLLC